MRSVGNASKALRSQNKYFESTFAFEYGHSYTSV